MSTLTQLKAYALIKKKLASKYGFTEKTIQQIIDTIYIAAENNNFILTPNIILTLAADTNNLLEPMINWTLTEEKQLEQAQKFLDMIPFIITSNGVLFAVNKVEGE